MTGPTTEDGTAGGGADDRNGDTAATRDRLRRQRLRHFVPQPMRRRPGGRWYSRLVATAKLTLPVVAVIALATTFLWDELRQLVSGSDRLSIPDLTVAGPAGEDPSAAVSGVMNPRFESVDENDNPYRLSATEASQVAAESEVMAMDAPTADFMTADGANIALVADAGRFDEAGERVLLEGAVEVSHEDGTRFQTEAATVDIGAGHAWGDRPIVGTGSFGEVEAEGFRIFDRGQAVVFVGRSRLLLPGAGDADPQSGR